MRQKSTRSLWRNITVNYPIDTVNLYGSYYTPLAAGKCINSYKTSNNFKDTKRILEIIRGFIAKSLNEMPYDQNRHFMSVESFFDFFCRCCVPFLIRR